MMAFLNGAGSIRAYPHAENTGLVISDVAKIGTIFQKCKFLRDFLLNEPFEPWDWSRTRGTGPCLTQGILPCDESCKEQILIRIMGS